MSAARRLPPAAA